jgi:secondary thiamine-phosphate synthase enzyme
MKVHRKTLTVSTRCREEMIDITDSIRTALGESGVRNGVVTIHIPHTTAAVTINENADPDVIHDILLALNKLIPQGAPGYRHSEGNSDAHVKSSLFGCTRQVLIEDSRLVLGTWQGIYFCEFDGPRSRRCLLHFCPDPE